MKEIVWSKEKNEALMHSRKISFELMVEYIRDNKLVDVVENPNQEKYPDQKIFVVEHEGYCYLIPFLETETVIFLKTIIPSRKATKQYKGGGT